MLKHIILTCMLSAAVSADCSTKSSDEAIISLRPSPAFLKASNARHAKQHKLSPQITSLLTKKDDSSDKDLRPSGLAELVTLLGGCALGSTISLLFPEKTKAAGIPLLVVAAYFFFDGQLPTGSLLEGADQLYKLLLILAQSPEQRSIDILTSLFKNPQILGDVHASSLLGRFCAAAQDLINQDDLSKNAQKFALKKLIKKHKNNLESWVRTLALISHFMLATTSFALVASLRKPENA